MEQWAAGLISEQEYASELLELGNNTTDAPPEYESDSVWAKAANIVILIAYTFVVIACTHHFNGIYRRLSREPNSDSWRYVLQLFGIILISLIPHITFTLTLTLWQANLISLAFLLTGCLFYGVFVAIYKRRNREGGESTGDRENLVEDNPEDPPPTENDGSVADAGRVNITEHVQVDEENDDALSVLVSMYERDIENNPSEHRSGNEPAATRNVEDEDDSLGVLVSMFERDAQENKRND